MNNTKNRITIDHHITDRAGCSLAITAAASSSRRRRWGCYSRAHHPLLYRPPYGRPSRFHRFARLASGLAQDSVAEEGGEGRGQRSRHFCWSSFFFSFSSSSACLLVLPFLSCPALFVHPVALQRTPPKSRHPLAIVVVVIVRPSSVARRSSSSPGVLPPELRLKGDYQPARARSNTTSMETSPNDYTTPLSTTLLPPTTCAPTHRQSLPHQHRGHRATAAAICRTRGAALVLAAESSR